MANVTSLAATERSGEGVPNREGGQRRLANGEKPLQWHGTEKGVGRRDDRVHSALQEENINVPKLQFLVGHKSFEPSTNVKRTRIDYEIVWIFHDELRNHHDPSQSWPSHSSSEEAPRSMKSSCPSLRNKGRSNL
ncbi:hypothetical protein RJT34_25443 [Clitoria ternatea]|uniref:Uncharacterized protein n=1 Tax=Clitoria ternatea TaxID=43366 RepID=A0AAN9FPW2_CLITE